MNNPFKLYVSIPKDKIVHKGKQKKVPLSYKWELYQIEGKQFIEIFSSQRPETKFKSGLSSEFIVFQLNKGERFDFSYQPKNGDFLYIEETTDKYMEFTLETNGR